MIKKGVAEIVADVKVCIDEIGINESEFLSSTDNLEMDTIIESKIPDALRYANLNADISLLEPVFYQVAGSNAKGVVKVTLGDDFIRLCYAKLPDWNFPVTLPIIYTEKAYASLHNPITTGYPDNPKAAIVETIDSLGNYAKVLELYSTNSTEDSVTAVIGYANEPAMEDGMYSIPDKLYRGIIYYISWLLLTTYKDANADSMLAIAMSLLGISLTNKQ